MSKSQGTRLPCLGATRAVDSGRHLTESIALIHCTAAAATWRPVALLAAVVCSQRVCYTCPPRQTSLSNTGLRFGAKLFANLGSIKTVRIYILFILDYTFIDGIYYIQGLKQRSMLFPECYGSLGEISISEQFRPHLALHGRREWPSSVATSIHKYVQAIFRLFPRKSAGSRWTAVVQFPSIWQCQNPTEIGHVVVVEGIYVRIHAKYNISWSTLRHGTGKLVCQKVGTKCLKTLYIEFCVSRITRIIAQLE